MAQHINQPLADEWVSFPGGELEGTRPKALCPSCREMLNRTGADLRRPARTLCFQCYRVELDRERAIRAAGELNTASEARFQNQLPFEPVDRARLDMLKVERANERAILRQGLGRFVDRRRQAQIAARHTLQTVVAGVRVRHASPADRERTLAWAAHVAELQLPEAWLPFVVSR